MIKRDGMVRVDMQGAQSVNAPKIESDPIDSVQLLKLISLEIKNIYFFHKFLLQTFHF
jgi:hypothetical protein